MKNFLSVFSPISILIAAISCVANTAPNDLTKTDTNIIPTEQVDGKFQPIAVIELFTSQGCSSCPPADELLTKTIQEDKGKSIYALSFHVDYWDRLGWKDPFSDMLYSQRQYDYVRQMQLNSAYTPQMVVNGQREFVGSNASNLKAALSQALKTNAEANFSNLVAVKKGEEWEVTYKIDGDFQNKKLNIALVSEQEITKIKRGENSGRTLQSNNVVRNFESIPPSANGTFTIDQSASSGNDGKQAIVVYLQDKNTLKITAAGRVAL